MAVTYRDYYEILGVPRTATKDEIQRAYRKIARKSHPDVNKAKDAEEKFKQINEAYEVLKDPEKRKRFDELGQNWQAGQEFRPPPGWDVRHGFGRGGGGQTEFEWGEGGEGGFSDFFESLFGGQGFRQGRGGAGGFQRGGGQVWRQAGADQEATMRIPLEEAIRGGVRPITLQSQTVAPSGQIAVQEKRYDVNIPPGILSGQRVRLSGQGGEGAGGGPRGDLYLKVEVEPHPVFRVEGRDISMDVPVTPWEAVLGGEVPVNTPTGSVTLKIPPGTQSGQKLRLRGKGMPNPKGPAGDLYAIVTIRVPKKPTKQERELFEQLRDVSNFNPRQ